MNTPTNEQDGQPSRPIEQATGVPDVAPQNQSHGDEVSLNLKPLGWLPMLVIAAVFIGLLTALFFIGYVPNKARTDAIARTSEASADARPIVSTTRPYRGQSLPGLTLPGATQAFRETQIFPRASGYLKTRNVDIGDRVTEGQLLAEIEIPEVQAQLGAAKAHLVSAQATLAQTRDQFELAKSIYERWKSIPNGAVSNQELEEHETSFLTARGALASAEGTVQADQSEIERLETLVGFSKVVAPFAGVINARNYDIGALLTSGTSGNVTEMFHIAQTDVLRVVVDVPQSYFDQVNVGSPASFVVRNFPNRPFEGKIARTAGSVDSQTRTVRVEADFQNADGRLLPGMYGQVRLELGQKEKPLLIPTSALVFGSSGIRVALVDGDGKLKFATVALGRDFGTEVEVLSGLQGDEQVVANPGERLTDGLAVQLAGPKQTPGPVSAAKVASTH